MATDSRTFTADRQTQGFKSQAHLDAFYAHYDHVTACQECARRNGWVELSDGWQPTQGECAIAQRLAVESFKF